MEDNNELLKDSEAVVVAESKEIKSPKRPLKKIIIGITVMILAVFGIYSYYIYTSWYPGTDNAYVNARLLKISPKVGGYVKKVYVSNNEYVKKGTLLLTIDKTDYELKLEEVERNLLLSTQKQQAAKEQIEKAESEIIKAKSSDEYAQSTAERYKKLYQEDAVTEEDTQEFATHAKVAAEEVSQAKIALKTAKTQFKLAKTNVSLEKVLLKQAKLNLSYTSLYAPANGYVTDLSLYKGQLVSKEQSLFGFVGTGEWWVDANFKETDLRRVHKGQSVEVKLDMYDHEFKGIVESVSFASGNIFSLLPSQNATGN